MKKMLLVMAAIALLAIGSVTHAVTTYQLDDGSGTNDIGYIPGGDLWWGNAFSVVSGAEKITAIQIVMPFADQTSGMNIGDPFNVLLYSDTNGDSDPRSGLSLLQIVASTVQDTGGLDIFQTIIIPETTVSGVFFVAASLTQPVYYYPARIDETTPAGKSWAAFAAAGTMNLADVGSNPSMNTIDFYGFPGNWMIRAQGEDGSAVPEPATLLGFGIPMLMVGLGKLRGLRR